ncbi:MAG TPA: MFS transporter [Rhodoglobus sp.]|nr:MFS transporter [Rhodoglobus sp.]
MKRYGSLLRVPGVARLLFSQLLARFPGGMLSLGLILHIEARYDSYGSAGLVLAGLSVGQAVSGPLTSRWMGRWGMRPVLILTTAVCAVALVVIALVPLELGVTVAVALLAGLSYPPIQPAVRTIYPKMVNSTQLTPLYSLDATAQEVIWVTGPVLVTFVGTQVSTELAIMLSVLFLVAGGIWFISSPELGRVRIPRSKRRFGAVLARPVVLLTTVVGLLLVGGFSAIETAVVATFGDHGAEAGIVLGIWSIASLIGGLALGHSPITPWSMARRLGLIAAGSILAIAAFDFWTLTGALVIAGFCIAPALTVMFAVVSASVRFSDTAEAYGWVGTGQLIGAAVGSAIAGFVIDGVGADGGLWVASGMLVLGTLIAVVFRRAIPDLRGRDASPIPDTEPVPTQPS